MITIELKGGMGNQMFQFAFAKHLSLKYNQAVEFDLRFLKRRDLGENMVYRNYDLDIFQLSESFLEEAPVKFKSIEEPHFHYSPSVLATADKALSAGFLKKPKNIFIQGYWQSPKYFQEHWKEIAPYFNFKDSVLDNDSANYKKLVADIQTSNSVMINFRRADFVENDFHGVKDMDYVKEAISILQKTEQDLRFFIFSDDIEWCKNNVHLENSFIVDHSFKGPKFSHYLELMKICKHFIIPNSTFAWWAAFLNENPNKKVIAPIEWFGDKTINTQDIIPEDWVRI